MNKKKMILWGIVLLVGLILTGCVGHYGGYGYDESPYYYGGYGHGEYPYYDNPYPSHNCPGDYGMQYCPH